MCYLRQLPTYLLVLSVCQLALATAADGAPPRKPVTASRITPTAAKSLTPTELTAAESGTPYKDRIHLALGSTTATSPFTLVVGGGALPGCLQMTTDGVVSGTPDARCVGTYRFVVYITSYNGEQASGSYLIHVNEGSASEASKEPDEKHSEPDKAAVPEVLPDCGLLITSVLGDGATQVKGIVNKDAVDEDSLIAFCRSPSIGKPRACLRSDDGRPDTELFEPLAGENGYYVSPTVKSGTFSAILLEPLDYGDSLNAVLVKHKRCVEKPFGVEAPKAAVTSEDKSDKQKHTATRPDPKASQEPKPTPAGEVPPKRKTATGSPQPLRKEPPSLQILPPKQQTAGAVDGSRSRALLVSAFVAPPSFSEARATASSPQAASATQTRTTPPPSATEGAQIIVSPDLASSPAVRVGTPPPSENAESTGHSAAESQHSGFTPASPSVAVMPGADWGRIRATFVLGILLANDTSQLSSAHQFYDFLLEKYWSLPGCYLCASPSPKVGEQYSDNQDQRSVEQDQPLARNWIRRHYPGVNTYFETRLTAIPVSSNPSTAAAGAGTTTATNAIISKDADTTVPAAAASSGGTFLTTQKTARVAVGADLPFLITRWDWRRKPNALFFAPLAKIGFDTLTGSLNQTIVAPNGGTTTASYERLYNYYAFGGRLGHYTLSRTLDSAPEWNSFLDVVVGRFSNLQSYICQPKSSGSGLVAISNTQCASAYGGTADAYVDSLKRPYRLDFEGALKVPYLPLLLGFNANLGQHAISTGHIDPAFNTPDDLRFLFGTKFDVASFLNKLGLSSLGK